MSSFHLRVLSSHKMADSSSTSNIENILGSTKEKQILRDPKSRTKVRNFSVKNCELWAKMTTFGTVILVWLVVAMVAWVLLPYNKASIRQHNFQETGLYMKKNISICGESSFHNLIGGEKTIRFLSKADFVKQLQKSSHLLHRSEVS